VDDARKEYFVTPCIGKKAFSNGRNTLLIQEDSMEYVSNLTLYFKPLYFQFS
jgi:hypothetical protein